MTFGVSKGLFVAAASDACGYVSQADMWARGNLVVHQPFALRMKWTDAAAALAPLGYRPHRPGPQGSDLVPIYAPGVPLLMALFKLAGGAKAVYLVVPLLGGLAVWATFLMGAQLAGPWVGAAAAVLLATSPTFLFEVTAPASDVAATTWWALAMALVMSTSSRALAGAGVAAGLAILTRPNLLPLALTVALPLVWPLFRGRGAGGAKPSGLVKTEWRERTRRVLLYAMGPTATSIVVALLYGYWYGSPLASGYGSLSEIYGWRHVVPNLARYPRWIVETQTPLVIFAVAAPFVLRTRRADGGDAATTAVAWLASFAVILGSFLLYSPWEEWWYVRFLMPLFPALLVLTTVVVVKLLAPLNRVVPRLSVMASVVVIGLMAWHGLRYSIDRGAHLVWRAEQRYREVGEYVNVALPRRAALLSMQHSCSARHYSGRVTVRYDYIRPRDFEFVVRELRRLGYAPYLVLDDWEEPRFRERFEGVRALGQLDWMPIAAPARGAVRIYYLGERLP